MSPIKHKKKKREEEDEDNIFTRCGVLTSRILVNLHQRDQRTKGTRLGSPNVSRERIPVQVIFHRLGPALFKRAYRMTEASFWRLYKIILPHIPKKKTQSKKRKRGSTPNGDIPWSSRLSIALRMFAGGDPLDILQVHGVSYTEVYYSFWNIIDAINACPQLRIKFPNEYDKQKEIAAGFQQKSAVGFPNCIDPDKHAPPGHYWAAAASRWPRCLGVAGVVRPMAE